MGNAQHRVLRDTPSTMIDSDASEAWNSLHRVNADLLDIRKKMPLMYTVDAEYSTGNCSANCLIFSAGKITA